MSKHGHLGLSLRSGCICMRLVYMMVIAFISNGYFTTNFDNTKLLLLKGQNLVAVVILGKQEILLLALLLSLLSSSKL